MESISTVLSTLGSGLPVLLLHLVITFGLLLLGILIYQVVTPFHEIGLIRQGNIAAAVVFLGALLGFAIPLAATLAVSLVALDILLWGVVAVIVQIVTFIVVSRLVIKDMGHQIEGGNVAAGLTLLGIQIAVGLVNAGAMSG
jgi:putative membrane protein